VIRYQLSPFLIFGGFSSFMGHFPGILFDFWRLAA
jgi:hypothetical protein